MLRHPTQHDIALVVSPGVVDLLETVDVDDEHRKRHRRQAAVPLLFGEQQFLEACPVGHPGQGVGRGDFLQSCRLVFQHMDDFAQLQRMVVHQLGPPAIGHANEIMLGDDADQFPASRVFHHQPLEIQVAHGCHRLAHGQVAGHGTERNGHVYMHRVHQRHLVVQQADGIARRHDADSHALLGHDHRIVLIDQTCQHVADRRVMRHFLDLVATQQIAQLLALQHGLRIKAGENIGVRDDAEQLVRLVDHCRVAMCVVEQLDHIQQIAPLGDVGKGVVARVADRGIEPQLREAEPHHIGRSQQPVAARFLFHHHVAHLVLRHLLQRMADCNAGRHAHDVGRGQFVDQRKKHLFRSKSTLSRETRQTGLSFSAWPS